MHSLAENAECHCDDCDWTGSIDGVRPINHPGKRLTLSEIVPAGECPECGALATRPTRPNRASKAATLRTVRDALVATRDNLTASLDSAVDLLEEIRRTNTDNDTATAIGEVLDQAQRWHPKATLQTTH